MYVSEVYLLLGIGYEYFIGFMIIFKKVLLKETNLKIKN